MSQSRSPSLRGSPPPSQTPAPRKRSSRLLDSSPIRSPPVSRRKTPSAEDGAPHDINDEEEERHSESVSPPRASEKQPPSLLGIARKRGGDDDDDDDDNDEAEHHLRRKTAISASNVQAAASRHALTMLETKWLMKCINVGDLFVFRTDKQMQTTCPPFQMTLPELVLDMAAGQQVILRQMQDTLIVRDLKYISSADFKVRILSLHCDADAVLKHTRPQTLVTDDVSSLALGRHAAFVHGCSLLREATHVGEDLE